MAWLPGVDERPFTVMNDDPLMLTVATCGPVHPRPIRAGAGRSPVGARARMETGSRLQGERPLLAAGGSGAATLGFLARVLRDRGQPITVALGARRRNLMMLAWRFRELGCDCSWPRMMGRRLPWNRGRCRVRSFAGARGRCCVCLWAGAYAVRAGGTRADDRSERGSHIPMPGQPGSGDEVRSRYLRQLPPWREAGVQGWAGVRCRPYSGGCRSGPGQKSQQVRIYSLGRSVLYCHSLE